MNVYTSIDEKEANFSTFGNYLSPRAAILQIIEEELIGDIL